MDCKPWSWSCFEPRPGFMQDQDQDLLVHQDQDQDQGLAQAYSLLKATVQSR